MPFGNAEYDLRFLSSSKLETKANSFAELYDDRFHSLIYTIKNNSGIKGIDAGSLTGHPREQEVIFGDEHTYRIEKVEEVNGNLFVSLLQL